MNDILSFVAGQAMAYMTIRLIVMVARGRFFSWAILCGFTAASSYGATTAQMIVQNRSGHAISVIIQDNGSGSYATRASNSSVPNGTDVTYTEGTYPAPINFRVLIYDAPSFASLCRTDDYPGVANASSATDTYYGCGVGGTTNYFFTGGTFTNTNSFTADFKLNLYSNAVVIRTIDFWLSPGEGVTVPGMTNSYQNGWEIYGPGGAANDFRDVVLKAQIGSPITEAGPGPGTPVEISANPNPTREYWTNSIPVPQASNLPGSGTDTRAADRLNTDGIIKAVADSSAAAAEKISNTIEDKQFTATNSVSVSVTNGVSVTVTNLPSTNSMDMGWTNILKEISTNTMVTTNLLFTNQVESAVASAINTLFSTATNEFNASDMATKTDDWMDKLGDTETDQGAVAVPGTGDPLAYTIHTRWGDRTVNFNLLSSAGVGSFSGVSGLGVAGPKTMLIKWAHFIRSWILKLIPFVMFWLVTRQCLQWQGNVMKALLQLPKGFDLFPSKILGKGILTMAVNLIMGLVVGLLPTALVAYAESITLYDLNAAVVPSVTGHIGTGAESGSGWLGSVAAWYNVVVELIPVTTFVVSAVNYGLFQLYGEKLMFLIMYCLVRVSPIMALVPLTFAFAVRDSRAGQVEILNYSGTNVLWSSVNTPVQLEFPPGQHLLNMEAGDWSVVGFGVSNFVVNVPDSEDRLVVRLEATHEVSWSMAEAEWSWFWAGYRMGIPIWGLVAAVAVMRGAMVDTMKGRMPGAD